jgi:hypothetical protein
VRVSFSGIEYDVKFGRYMNGATRIDLIEILSDSEDGEPITTATTCIPSVELRPDEVLIFGPGEVAVKDYSENAGITAALVEAGVIEPPHRSVRAGYAEARIARLRPEALAQLVVRRSDELREVPR